MLIKTVRTYCNAHQTGTRFWLWVLCFITVLPAFSQKYKKQVEKADVLFYEKKYGEAYASYRQIYLKHADDKDLLLKMADCNYLIDNLPLAQEYYARYFSDTIYSGIDQFTNYALATKKIGKVKLAAKLYRKIYENKQDSEAKSNYEIFGLYADSTDNTRSFNLDSNYKCVVLDAAESVDNEAAPLIYIWNLGDGVVTEGQKIEHCFTKTGANRVSLSVRDINTGVVHLNDTSIIIYIDSPPVTFTVSPKRSQFIDIYFNGEGTQVPGYDLIEYIWDMGNGETMRGNKIKYKYNNKGTYKVKLTVVAENTSTKTRQLFSSWREIEVQDIYTTPGKTYTDLRNEAK